jgi:hypothetical protein
MLRNDANFGSLIDRLIDRAVQRGGIDRSIATSLLSAHREGRVEADLPLICLASLGLAYEVFEEDMA